MPFNTSSESFYPESLESRTLQAADQIIAEKLARVILIGNREKILKAAREKKLNHIEQATIVDPLTHEKKDHYINSW
jgi:phosphate acetyltransferase